jgi:hypothetical protein
MEKPRTKVGQVRQAWPDIRDLLAAGHSLKDIRVWLNEIGLEIGYARLSDYIGRLRRQDEAAQSETRALQPGLHETGAALVTETNPERQNRMAPEQAAWLQLQRRARSQEVDLREEKKSQCQKRQDQAGPTVAITAAAYTSPCRVREA